MSQLLPTELESTYVHDVYDNIASHFSSTRYKAWPLISSFLQALPKGSIGLDAGCGNGKYLNVATPLTMPDNVLNKDVMLLGLDRSVGLLGIARDRGHEAILSDCIYPVWRDAIFDFVISIATIHHLSTPSRRKDSIKALLSSLRPQGQLLIQVWASEQSSEKSLARRGTLKDTGNEQDVFVPWTTRTEEGEEKVFQRYYHLYRKGELEEEVREAGKEMGVQWIELMEGWEKGNWYVVALRT